MDYPPVASDPRRLADLGSAPTGPLARSWSGSAGSPSGDPDTCAPTPDCPPVASDPGMPDACCAVNCDPRIIRDSDITRTTQPDAVARFGLSEVRAASTAARCATSPSSGPVRVHPEPHLQAGPAVLLLARRRVQETCEPLQTLKVEDLADRRPVVVTGRAQALKSVKAVAEAASCSCHEAILSSISVRRWPRSSSAAARPSSRSATAARTCTAGRPAPQSRAQGRHGLSGRREQARGRLGRNVPGSVTQWPGEDTSRQPPAHGALGDPRGRRGLGGCPSGEKFPDGRLLARCWSTRSP